MNHFHLFSFWIWYYFLNSLAICLSFSLSTLHDIFPAFVIIIRFNEIKKMKKKKITAHEFHSWIHLSWVFLCYPVSTFFHMSNAHHHHHPFGMEIYIYAHQIRAVYTTPTFFSLSFPLIFADFSYFAWLCVLSFIKANSLIKKVQKWFWLQRKEKN